MADIAIFRINYKSDFILTLQSDAGWLTPFCIKFWTGAPSKAYYAYYDGMSYTHCTPVEGDPTKLLVQFDDHHLPIGDLKFQIGYHFTVADFPTSIEDEVINQASVIIEVDDAPAQVMLDFNGETAPEIEFSLPAYANEAQRIANEQARIAAEEQRIANEQARISAEETRQANEQQRINAEAERVSDFASLKTESEAATAAANIAATLANEKAQLADDKAALAQAAATLANAKAQLAADKAALAQAAATLANEKAALAQQKAEYAQEQGDAAKTEAEAAHSLNEEVSHDEATRDQAEQIRQQQETARQQAESQRVTDFNAQMQQQQTAYADAEAARDTAFDEAETERDAKVDAKVADITNLQAQIGYFVCDTGASVAAKTVVATNYVLGTGGSIKVKMTNDNTVNNATLNINSTGAKPLFYEGARASSTNTWAADDVLEIYYDGTNYQARNISPTFKTGEKVNNVGIDDEPTAGSENVVKSGGVEKSIIPYKVGISNEAAVVIEDWNENRYYDLSNVNIGDIVNEPSVSSTGLRCKKVACNINDVFIVKRTPGLSPSIYAITDLDNKLIYKSGTNINNYTEIYVTFPNAAYILFNISAQDYALKGEIIADKIRRNNEGTKIIVSNNAINTNYHIIAGKKYLIYNNCERSGIISTRNGSTTVETLGTVAAGKSILFEASENANVLRNGTGFGNGEIIVYDEDSIPYKIIAERAIIEENTSREIQQVYTSVEESISKKGFEDADGFVFPVNRYHTYFTYPGGFVPGNIYLFEIVSGTDENQNVRLSTYDDNNVIVEQNIVLLSYNYPNRTFTFVPTEYATKIGYIDQKNYGMQIRIKKLNNASVITRKLFNSSIVPMVKLKKDHIIKDVSEYLANIRLTSSTFADSIISELDTLVAEYPNDIEKIDAGEYVNLSYPAYARLNGVATETYLATPSYNIWLYKISSLEHYEASIYNNKRKLFIVGGTHGEEKGGILNAYILAEMLCKEFLNDSNLFKLRTAYDIYILPILNVYGSYHSTRVNANGVNINRNFYIGTYSGPLIPGDRDYPGATGCGEFETDLIVKLTDKIKPNVAIDCHSNMDVQFYTFSQNEDLLKIAFDNLCDVSYVLKKEYPTIYGSDYSLLKSISSPWSIQSDTGTMSNWWDTRTPNWMPTVGALIETCTGHSYTNGEWNGMGGATDSMTIEPLKIAEYVFRIQLLSFCQYDLDNMETVKTNAYSNNKHYV